MKYKGVVIDAGHGGEDSGASGNSIIEKNMTLDISKELYNKLKLYNIPVKLTRDSDITLSPSERTEKIKSAFGNSEDVLVISNHINAGGGDGAEVIYALRNKSTLADLILEELRNQGQNSRKAYQRRLPSDTSKDYYFIHRDTGITEPVIVEYGFLDSTGDDPQLLKRDYIKLADAVAKAVVQYMGLSYDIDNTYIVKSGDSLWSIAKKFNTSVEKIKELNNLSSNLLSVGQVLKIPTVSPTNVDYKVYIVKSGDSLYKIASDNNVSLNKLIEYNNLSSTNLSIGQQIRIPIISTEIPSNYTNYTVKSGDSLYQIAIKFNTTASKIKDFNNLSTNTLSIGQVLKIPTSAVQESTPPTSYIEYVVKSGDSLYKIADNYNVTVDELKSFNNLSSILLRIGQIVKIPIQKTSNTYVVKSGDSLYQIALKFNTTVDELKKKNSLSTNNLSIGQILIV